MLQVMLARSNLFRSRKNRRKKSDQNQTRQHIYNQCHSENVQSVTAGRGKVAKAVFSDVGFRHAMDLCKREIFFFLSELSRSLLIQT